MEETKKVELLVEGEQREEKRNRKFRDTVLIRVDRKIKNEVKELSKRLKEPMSRIADWALREHLRSVKPVEEVEDC